MFLCGVSFYVVRPALYLANLTPAAFCLCFFRNIQKNDRARSVILVDTQVVRSYACLLKWENEEWIEISILCKLLLI
jgi:hypothetical protein